MISTNTFGVAVILSASAKAGNDTNRTRDSTRHCELVAADQVLKELGGGAWIYIYSIYSIYSFIVYIVCSIYSL